MVRIAAVGDLHARPGTAARLRPEYQRVAEVADLLLLAGDLTQDGGTDSAAEVCDLFGGLDLPVIAVLGNHDYARGEETTFTEMLTDAGVTVLEGTATVVDTAQGRVGIAGVKGFGGGFAGRTIAKHCEPEMKVFGRHGAATAQALGHALDDLDVDLHVALTHYAPTRTTLVGEPLELYPFLGSHLLGAAIDGEPVSWPEQENRTEGLPLTGMAPSERRQVKLALHGHAHYGTEAGATPAGTEVRNVAAPVIGAPFAVYRLPEVIRIG
ncbi:Calcineurin-like phosphoesterase [Parafrankia irregularis]|uniref:Calcineurin-like phosphoesterase n=1 Tax=Parafrankia irregularis TaxID=795642 RepID=A0A0S4QL74_9ACTN|nr:MULTISPECIES: metallophosphoesterase [Parafrankia]MBE3201160.1 metallophosphoesterase [Parafrankia sp. CH37]CUU56405.1 Calcineurin-like phosphoesterase [Parafrankia irregularis]